MGKPAKLALLVGIKEYENAIPDILPGGLHNLKGCENDITELERVLKEDFQFDIFRKLPSQEEKATGEAILSAFDDLAKEVNGHDGSIVVIHYSGHGSQMRDVREKGDELDRWDETLVPYDRGRNVPDITDDQLYVKVSNLTTAAEDVHVCCIIDACHSGTVLRSGVFDDIRKAPHSDYVPLRRIVPRVVGDRGPSKWLPKSDAYILLAACADGQTAQERLFEYNGEKVYFGALTFFLLQELRSMRASPQRWSYQELYDRVCRRVKACFPSQDPQLEGARNRRVFGGGWDDPPAYFEVPKIIGRTATIRAGQSHGLSRGTVLSIKGLYSKGGDVKIGETKWRDLKKATILKEPDATRCVAELEEFPAESFLGGRATVLEFAAESQHFQLPVALDGGLHPQFRKMVQDSLLLREVEGHEAATVWVHLDSDDRIWLCGPEGYLLIPTSWRVGESDVITEISESLTKIARYHNVVSWNNRDDERDKHEESRLKDKVRLEMRKIVEGKEVEEVSRNDGGYRVVQVGARVRLIIVNEYAEPVYVNVLQCGRDGSVYSVYPGGEGIQANRVPGRGSETPAGTFEVDPPTGRVVLKLIATGQPADFRVFLQTGLKGLRLRGRGAPLHRWFNGVWHGLKEKVRIARDEVWTTYNLEFWIVDESTPLATLLASPKRYCPDVLAPAEAGG
jgi:hypothetical protein